MVLGATAIAFVIVAFLWRQVPHPELLGWFSLILASALLRAMVFRGYRRQRDATELSDSWARYFYAGSFVAGCVWGVLPVLFYTSMPTHYLLLLSTIFAGMVSVTATAGSIYLPSFYAFALPLVLPVSLLHLFSGLDYLAVTGVMLLLYLLVNSLFAHRGHRQYIELIEARFENSDLMQQLSAEKAIAEEAVIIKNQFVAAASHDLRQPLHALGMFIGSLRKRENNAQRLEIIRDMETSTAAMSQLLHGMLDLSRLDAGLVEADLRAVELDPVLRGLTAEFQSLAAQKNLHLQIEPANFVLFTDALLLERVIRNLVSNAIRYTQQGSVVVEAHRQETGGYCELRVRDTGCGIAPEQQQAVFEAYRQLNTPDESSHGGLGLGLSIVSRFCALLEVPLTMHSRLGAGTEIILQVPLATGAANASPAAATSRCCRPIYVYC